MIPCLVIAVAAWYGYWVRYLSYSVGYRLNSDKVDGTTKDVCSVLVDDISSRRNMEDHVSEISSSCIVDKDSLSIWIKPNHTSELSCPCIADIAGDHISELPHELLSHILSFLSVRDVVRIAASSKKLRNVCLALPYLKLDWSVMSGHPKNYHTEDCEIYQKSFVKNVDQFLKWYRNPEFLSLRFSFCLSKVYASDIDRWINFAATQKRLESLNLQFVCCHNPFSRIGFQLKRDDLHTISTSFISHFSRLKDMNLDTCHLKVQSNLRLNSLVTLDLNYVLLEPTPWECFLSGFPAVQWLRLSHCNLPEKLCIRNGVPRLTFLMIDCCVELLELELNASRLKSFEFTGKVALRQCVLNAPQLENVFVWPREPGGGDCLLCNIAKSAFGLKSLVLRGSRSMIYKLPKHPSSLFRSVLRLHLSARHSDWGDDIVKVLPVLLKSFPSLEKLYVKLPFHSSRDRCRWLKVRNYDPSQVYLHSKLNEIELSEFCEMWVDFAIYLLRSAIALDRMVINSTLKDYLGCGKWTTCRKILAYDQNSLECTRDAMQKEAISPSAEVFFVN